MLHETLEKHCPGEEVCFFFRFLCGLNLVSNANPTEVYSFENGLDQFLSSFNGSCTCLYLMKVKIVNRIALPPSMTVREGWIAGI